MKLTLALLASMFLFVLPSCGLLTPQQKGGILGTLQQEYADGNITKAQYDAAVESINNDKPFDWETLGIVGANILLSLIGGPIIVRKMRGPATQKVGLPADMIVPVEPNAPTTPVTKA